MSERGGELRLDPLTGEWVTIVGHRQARPNLPASGCPFCVGGLEAPEPYVVRAFENRWPALAPGTPVDAGEPPDEPFARLPARGAAEVVLYTPDHDASMASLGTRGARLVVDLWAERTAALLARPEIEYVLVFENRGREVGATIDHPHGQIYAFPFVPPAARRELEVARERGCPLCRALHDERSDGSRLVAELGGWTAYVPFASGWPYGMLVVPHDHVDGLPALDGPSRDALAGVLVDVLDRYDRLFDRPFPYMLWVHQLPGSDASHLHLHLAPPLRGPDTMRFVAAGELGSGTLSNPVTPEAAAGALRGAVPPGPRHGSGRRR
ncbi:MAG: galactose-1-phosphate uridylyltransferase [Acidimicrobiia bacterium]|nr:galactose-1-phosphate uridylyltransferase [Acidimicrobiia bacterium]